MHCVREALRARRRPLYELRVDPGRTGPEIREIVRLAEAAAVPVVEAKPGRGEDDRHAQGVVLEAGPLPELPLEQLVGLGDSPRTLVALDGVEDPQNVGAIARVAEAAGAAALILTARRAPPLSAALARASAGAIEWLPVARVGNLSRALRFLKGEGYWVFGAEVGAPCSLYELPERWLTGDRVLMLGAEGRGLRAGIVNDLDHRVEIPMMGAVSSLNVGAAAAVMLFELARRSGSQLGRQGARNRD